MSSDQVVSRNRFLLVWLYATVSIFALSACASAPQPPTQELQAAELAITGAEQAGVADYASVELNEARTKLAAAQTAVDSDEMVLAERLAHEARVSAELATARAEMLEAREVNEDMRRSIDVLRQELQRNSGAAQ